MTRRHDPAWVWMIGAFGGALALAVAVLAGYGTGPDGLKLGLRITARCVIQRRNFRELDAIIEAAHDIGLDQISFLSADVSSEAFNRPAPWGD